MAIGIVSPVNPGTSIGTWQPTRFSTAILLAVQPSTIPTSRSLIASTNPLKALVSLRSENARRLAQPHAEYPIPKRLVVEPAHKRQRPLRNRQDHALAYARAENRCPDHSARDTEQDHRRSRGIRCRHFPQALQSWLAHSLNLARAYRVALHRTLHLGVFLALR